MSIILGFSNTHNGSVALICNGEVKVAIRERTHGGSDRVYRLEKKLNSHKNASGTV